MSEKAVCAKLLSRARRMANRKRAEKACINCHAAKTRCSGCRPCNRCIGRQVAREDFESEDVRSSSFTAIADESLHFSRLAYRGSQDQGVVLESQEKCFGVDQVRPSIISHNSYNRIGIYVTLNIITFRPYQSCIANEIICVMVGAISIRRKVPNRSQDLRHHFVAAVPTCLAWLPLTTVTFLPLQQQPPPNSPTESMPRQLAEPGAKTVSLGPGSYSGAWLWELADGPGPEDPFHEDWTMGWPA